MKHPIMIGLSAAALLAMLLILVAAPEFAKENWILFGVVFLFGVVRLVSWLAASSEETKVEEGILAARQETERAIEATGQTAASVWVYRIPSFIAKLGTIEVFCDGTPIASLDNGSCALCKVAPGQHAFSSPVSSKPIQLSLEPGQEYFIRTGVTGIASRVFENVPKQQADSEMSKL